VAPGKRGGKSAVAKRVNWLRIAAIAIALILPWTTRGADWPATLSHVRPGPIAPRTAFRGEYQLGWAAIRAGRATVELNRQRANAHLDIQASTTGAARALWRFDVRHSADADGVSLRPIAVEQVEKYRGETVTTKLKFDRAGVVRWRFEEPSSGGEAKAKRFNAPGIFDLQTALLWIRTQPLATGDTYRLLIYPGSTPYFAEVTVIGSDRVKAANRVWNARELTLRLRRVDRKTMRLLPHRAFKSGHAWISDDENRFILKARAEIFVGSVWMELTRMLPAP
jgi:hypothetical protein